MGELGGFLYRLRYFFLLFGDGELVRSVPRRDTPTAWNNKEEIMPLVYGFTMRVEQGEKKTGGSMRLWTLYIAIVSTVGDNEVRAAWAWWAAVEWLWNMCGTTASDWASFHRI